MTVFIAAAAFGLLTVGIIAFTFGVMAREPSLMVAGAPFLALGVVLA